MSSPFACLVRRGGLGGGSAPGRGRQHGARRPAAAAAAAVAAAAAAVPPVAASAACTSLPSVGVGGDALPLHIAGNRFLPTPCPPHPSAAPSWGTVRGERRPVPSPARLSRLGLGEHPSLLRRPFPQLPLSVMPPAEALGEGEREGGAGRICRNFVHGSFLTPTTLPFGERDAFDQGEGWKYRRLVVKLITEESGEAGAQGHGELGVVGQRVTASRKDAREAVESDSRLALVPTRMLREAEGNVAFSG